MRTDASLSAPQSPWCQSKEDAVPLTAAQCAVPGVGIKTRRELDRENDDDCAHGDFFFILAPSGEDEMERCGAEHSLHPLSRREAQLDALHHWPLDSLQQVHLCKSIVGGACATCIHAPSVEGGAFAVRLEPQNLSIILSEYHPLFLKIIIIINSSAKGNE